MSLRLAAVAAAVSLAAGGAPSYALRPAHHLVDPKGDARGNLGFADIATGNFSTTGRGDTRALVATLTLAGPPRTDGAVTYTLGADVDSCGHVEFQYTPLAVSTVIRGPKTFTMLCDIASGPGGTSSVSDEVSVSIKGRSITWSVPLAALRPEVGPGAVYNAFEAVADVADPVFGMPIGDIPNQSIDTGYGAGVWRVR